MELDRLDWKIGWEVGFMDAPNREESSLEVRARTLFPFAALSIVGNCCGM
jgi:hypothetical protein